MRRALSVLVPCGNSEDVITDCLKSVTWADEVVLVNSFSTDRTLAIAKGYASRILQHEYIDSATQKNWAIPQVANDWVLIVDTDERVSEELRQEIEGVLEDPGEFSGFKIPRLNYAWGRPLRHGGNYPDYQLRLFRKDRGRYQPRRVHAHVVLDGKCGILRNHFVHFGQRDVDQVVHHLLGQFTTWEAEERRSRGVRFSVGAALTRPVAAFLYRYVVLRGFMDGIPGLILAGFWAAYVFLTFAKIWEMERNGAPDLAREHASTTLQRAP
ncbi:MAG: glycosyltransferase family 2 protein [Chloroflexi bacterium]|nr:glycosyltransferase family 2 protein [Chloroflexota bacterium]